MYIDKLLNYQNIYHNNYRDQRIYDLMDEYGLDREKLRTIMNTTTSIEDIEEILDEEITLVPNDPSEKMFHKDCTNPEKEIWRNDTNYLIQYPYSYEIYENGQLVYSTLKIKYLAQKIGNSIPAVKKMFDGKDMFDYDRKVIVRSKR